MKWVAVALHKKWMNPNELKWMEWMKNRKNNNNTHVHMMLLINFASILLYSHCFARARMGCLPPSTPSNIAHIMGTWTHCYAKIMIKTYIMSANRLLLLLPTLHMLQSLEFAIFYNMSGLFDVCCQKHFTILFFSAVAMKFSVSFYQFWRSFNL